MPIEVKCQNCSKRYKLKDELTGKKFRCKECGEVVIATPIAPKATPNPRPSGTASAKSTAAQKPVQKKTDRQQSSPKGVVPSSSKSPRPTNPAKKKPTAPQEELFDDLDDFEDYGATDEYAPALPPPRKKSKKASSSKRKQAKQNSSLFDSVPTMTFNLNRINIAIVIGGMVMTFLGFQEMRLASKSNSTPVAITLTDLIQNGPGDNIYFTISDVVPSSDEYVYSENKYKRIQEVWVLCAPMESTGASKFILYSNKTPTQGDIDRLMSTTSHTGMIVNDIKSLDPKTKNLLRSEMPGINIETAYIFQDGRTPSGMLSYIALMLGGLAVSLGGLFWIFFLHSN